MKKNPLLGLCTSCWQLTTDCTCPARFERQRLIEAARKAKENPATGADRRGSWHQTTVARTDKPKR